MPTARSTPNIALIKYWGNRHEEFRLCAAESTSMTLDGPYVDVSVERSDIFSLTSNNKDVTENDKERFKQTLSLMENYLATIEPTVLSELAVHIDSHIPPGVGLASSAAVFSALAKAVSALVDANLSDEQISVLARLGSGSAARSVFGGFAAIRNEENLFIDASKGWQIANENHWKLHDIVIVPSQDEKKVGSTEGHAHAQTSPHFEKRMIDIGQRQEECIDAILQKDFEKLRVVSELDCLDMHVCMKTQTPPLQYLSEETHRILKEVQDLRESEHLPVLYTMDAGPTVHLICTDEAKEQVTAFAHSQEGCQIFESSTGRGAHLL